MPFTSRLEEMRNTARINLAIRDILNSGPEEIKRAKNTIAEVRKSTESNYQFIRMAETRLDVVEDFLWIISGDE
jgi:neutral trehalase